ncbi:MAG: hypothetical protein OHK0013_48030 [Sandaracinaceae bacterium]
MRSICSPWLVALALSALSVTTPASAQVVVQGEIVAQPSPQGEGQVQGQVVIQDANPQTVYAQPTVPDGYAAQPQGYAVAPQPIAPACPPPAQMMPDRWGRQRCMQEVTAHRVSGGLIGGGAGIFAGGYVLQVFVTLFSGIVGAFDTSGAYTADQLSNYVNWGFVPVLGPWVQMGFAPPFADGSLYAFLALEALMQAGGITMMVFGFIGEDVTEWRPIAGVDLEVRPMLGHAQGLTATFTF